MYTSKYVCKLFKGTVGFGVRKAISEQFIMDEDGTLLRDEFIRCFHNVLVTVWRTGDVPQPSKDATTFIKRRIALIATTSEGFRSLLFQAKCC